MAWSKPQHCFLSCVFPSIRWVIPRQEPVTPHPTKDAAPAHPLGSRWKMLEKSTARGEKLLHYALPISFQRGRHAQTGTDTPNISCLTAKGLPWLTVVFFISSVLSINSHKLKKWDLSLVEAKRGVEKQLERYQLGSTFRKAEFPEQKSLNKHKRSSDRYQTMILLSSEVKAGSEIFWFPLIH